MVRISLIIVGAIPVIFAIIFAVSLITHQEIPITAVVEEGYQKPDKKSTINKDKLKKLTALIKETGFMEIPTESFPVRDGVDNYQKSTIKVTLNGQIRQIHWVEQNATDKFIPPIISMIELELDQIINQLIE